MYLSKQKILNVSSFAHCCTSYSSSENNQKSTRIDIRTRTTTLIPLSEFIFKSMYDEKALIKIVVDYFFLFRDTKIDALKGVLLIWYHMRAIICTPNAKIQKIDATKISKYLFKRNYLFWRVVAFSQI